jgi:PhoH-like ATPase
MRKNIILDTNVLLHDPKAVFSFRDALLVIPIEVIEEVDSFKRDMTELGRNSRTVAQILDGLREKGKLGEGVSVGNDCILRVICDVRNFQSGHRSRGDTRTENRILNVAIDLQNEHPEEPTIVVTKNVNLRLKADALGLTAQDYDVDRSPDADVYTGWHTVESSVENVRALEKGLPADLQNFSGLPNEYVLVRTSGSDKPCALGRVGRIPNRVYPLADQSEGAAGIKPLNLEQRLAFDALLDDKIKLVSLTGKAGTGKTLLAVAAGLRKVFSEDLYNRLLIFRPTMPVGRDIGFLPGDVGEKMRPWMQPVYDALELIREQDKRSPNRMLPADILECEEISIEPLTFIRGRSIPHQYLIIDEAQNLTPLEVKTVITRVGNGTKIVLTGDPHQIDNPYVDSLSNGLVFLVNRFRNSLLSAHIGLQKGERSELAEAAANFL